MSIGKMLQMTVLGMLLHLPVAIAQTGISRADVKSSAATATDNMDRSYVLGPEDLLSIKIRNLAEIGDEPYAIDLAGNMDLPLIGSLHVAGLTISQLEVILVAKYREYVLTPKITVAIAEFRSQPISVLGEVLTPGVHQIRGRKTLFEAISEAGGLKSDAGNIIKITRRRENGSIPLPDSTFDSSNQFSIGHVSIKSVMEAQNPGDNIAVKPFDVITVPKAELVYVIGDVKRPGGFPLSEKPGVSLLEALALAEGLERTASPKNAKILRDVQGTRARTEQPIDIRKILSGQDPDVELFANDILFVPNSRAKTVSGRAIEAMIQVATGVAVYSHF